MSEKETRQFRKTYIAVGGICLCFLACSLLFVFHMMHQNEAENIQYLYDAANRNRTTLEKQVMGDYQTLEGIAICMAEAEIDSNEKITAILKKINEKNSFIRMGMADRSGKVDLLDIDGTIHRNMDVSDRIFFQEALKGDDSISNTFLDTLAQPGEKQYINYYGVPFWQGEEITNVLCAVNLSEMLRHILDAPLLNGQGYSSVIDSSGKLMIQSIRSDSAFNRRLSLDEVDEIAREERERILALMEKGESGEFAYVSDGEEQVGVFVPTAIHDWYVFSMISRSVLKQRYSQTALGVVLIIAAACIIFLLLLRRQNRLMQGSQAALIRLAYEDSLTGCRNLPRFILDAQSALGQDESVHEAIWYCDLKKFKYFNDVFGYALGDQALRYMAETLQRSMGEDGLFCRVSADSFAGMITYHRKEELTEWFEQLQSCLSSGDPLSANSLNLELCMGFYCVDEEEENLSVTDMVNRANMAQKSVKSLEGRQCAFFSKEIRDHILKEAELEASAKGALEAGEFLVYVQPKVNIQNGNRLTGAEALVRWSSREKGLISPAEFIPLFERTGFIVQLDRYVFEQVCIWRSNNIKASDTHIKLSINVSRIGVLQEDFVEYYSSVKERYGIPDFCLELEFTESMIVDDVIFKDTVMRIRKKGFVCSMDDFGSGYSSLNLLKNLPIDVLKLDILFFQEGTDIYRERVVISNVIAMARELQIKTIAEGVETEEQVDFLRSVGCDVVQGYIFAKPMPLKEFRVLLQRIKERDFKMEG